MMHLRLWDQCHAVTWLWTAVLVGMELLLWSEAKNHIRGTIGRFSQDNVMSNLRAWEHVKLSGHDSGAHECWFLCHDSILQVLCCDQNATGFLNPCMSHCRTLCWICLWPSCCLLANWWQLVINWCLQHGTPSGSHFFLPLVIVYN